MSAADDYLLAVTEEFDFLPLASVWCDQVDNDLLERLLGAEWDCEFRRLAGAGEHIPGVFVAVAYKRRSVTCRGRVENVGVECWHQPGERAGVGGIRPRLAPHVDLLDGDFL